MDYAQNYFNSMTKVTGEMVRTSLDRFKELIRNDQIRSNLVLDIGCGDGSATVQILKSFLGSDVALEASDVSEIMIKHAVANHGDHGVKFFVWDVLDETPVRDMSEKYDQVYSFLCFHYCQDLRKTSKNVYSILKPGGIFFFTMMVKLPFYEAFKKLSKYPVWAPYLNDDTINKYSAPLQFEEDPETFCRNLMIEYGFRNVKANLGIKIPALDSWNQFKGLAKFGDRFMEKLPQDLRQQYMQNYLYEMRNVENFISEKLDKDGNTSIEMNNIFYPYIICYGIKSSE